MKRLRVRDLARGLYFEGPCFRILGDKTCCAKLLQSKNFYLLKKIPSDNLKRCALSHFPFLGFVSGSPSTFSYISIHSKPDDAEAEINALDDVYAIVTGKSGSVSFEKMFKYECNT